MPGENLAAQSIIHNLAQTISAAQKIGQQNEYESVQSLTEAASRKKHIICNFSKKGKKIFNNLFRGQRMCFIKSDMCQQLFRFITINMER
jgi:hypothetical protein